MLKTGNEVVMRLGLKSEEGVEGGEERVISSWEVILIEGIRSQS